MGDLELAVKLLYLARLREYEFLNTDQKAQHILDSAAITEAVFDRWWTFRRLYLADGPSEQIEPYLAQAIEKVPPTGNAMVDEWLQSLEPAASD